MDDKDPNRERLALAALKLEPFLNEIIFIGGAIVGLLVTGTHPGRIRITRDVDVVVEVAGKREFHKMESRLRRAGFMPDTSKDAPICRWRIEGLLVDVMPTDERILGFANRWYRIAVQEAAPFELSERLVIRLVSAACFLATKVEAFLDRGNDDFLSSHDFEDIVTVVAGRENIAEELAAAPPEVRHYVSTNLACMMHSREFPIAVEGIVAPRAVDTPLLENCMDRFRQLAAKP